MLNAFLWCPKPVGGLVPSSGASPWPFLPLLTGAAKGPHPLVHSLAVPNRTQTSGGHSQARRASPCPAAPAVGTHRCRDLLLSCCTAWASQPSQQPA